MGLGLEGNPSLAMIDVTCFSTERWETTIRSPIARVRAALRQQPEHLVLARRQLGQREVSRRRPSIQRTTSGSSTEPPHATRRIASANSSMSEMRSFSR